MVQKAVKDAIALQQLLLKDAADPKTTPVARAAIARAWSCLQTSIREMRGIPLPGQLQPSLDPVLNAKRGKRGRLQTLDVSSFAEATEATTAPDAGKRPTPTPTKRATTTDDATTGEMGPG